MESGSYGVGLRCERSEQQQWVTVHTAVAVNGSNSGIWRDLSGFGLIP